MKPTKPLFPFIAIIILLLTINCNNVQAQSRGYLLALSKTDHTLAIVDPVSLKVLGKVPVGSDPHEVIASTDGKTAYVTIYGGGSLHEINVIDLVAKKPLTTIDTRPLYGPHGIEFVSGKVWFTAEGSKAVGSYDPATGKLDWSMGTGQDRTHMLYVTPDAKKIYTANINSGTVSILESTATATGPNARPAEWRQTIIATARGSEGFDVSPDGRELWTASGESGIISIVDLEGKKLAAQLDAKVQGANRLKISVDGKLVLISSLRTGEVTIYDAKTRKEVKRLKPGRGVAGILMDPDGTRAFVACTPDNYVAIINLKTLEVGSHIDVGGGPDGLAWAVQP
jgi:YVTN family beta-propeller protein